MVFSVKLQSPGQTGAKGISQEGLKILAAVSMLLDHIGAVFVPGYYGYYLCRVLGRLAFPVYCFLLAEGICHTRNPRKYGLRLLIGALVSEIPFDITFYGGLTSTHQSVMVTLLLGFCAMELSRKLPPALQVLPLIPFAWLAEWMHTDYGGWGVVLIGVFCLAKSFHLTRWQVAIAVFAVLLGMGGARLPFLWNFPIELFGLGALIPIFLYSGEKRRPEKRWNLLNYGFYPLHLTLLFLLKSL